MPKRRNAHPTEAETEILVLLWRHGPLTARAVHEHLFARRGTGYTTALKLLQTMFAKRLVRRDESERAHLYAAAVAEAAVQEMVVSTMVSRLFSGSVSRLVLRAIESAPTTAPERAEIRRLLDASVRRRKS